ncbi:IS5 family transposase [Streptacidiphilus sp. MAP12-16]|uniref:IS5 family transposase n=1 Tax=Streptacidiphilus sp. MAP12-16 TaxID=3156300 RepID=UPI003516BDAB
MVDDELWALIEPVLPPWPERSPGPRPVDDRLCLQGILFVLLTRITWQQLPPVDRGKSGSKHHLSCDGSGTPLKVITTGGNVPDITQALALVDGVPSVAGRPGRPPQRPESLLGDKGYDSRHVRRELTRRRILPVISRRGEPNIRGLGKLRYVIEQTFALLHQFKPLATRWERRLDLHDSLVSLACTLICWRRINKPTPWSCYEL